MPDSSTHRDTRPWIAQGTCRIDDLVTWTYRDQKADNFGAGGSLFEGERAASGVTVELQAASSAMILQHEQLGAKIDTSRNSGYDLHDVAMLVHEWVLMLPAMERGLVQSMGRIGGQPDLPRQFKPRIQPVSWKARPNPARGDPGRATSLCHSDYDGAGHRFKEEWTEVLVTNTREELLCLYDRYRMWALSLNSLAPMVEGDDRVDFTVTSVPVHLALRTRIIAESSSYAARRQIELSI